MKLSKMTLSKILLIFNTVKYLKLKQIFFRLFYLVRNSYRKAMGFQYEFTKESDSTPLKLMYSIDSYESYIDKEFIFLNVSKTFNESIDWNCSEFGKLWTYNLTYFEFLNQENLKQDTGIDLIYDFIAQVNAVKYGLEPFPISLRALNWIKFVTYNNIQDKKINDSLYAQYYILMDNLEYHLLGNHLLENGFSLLFGAYYFQDETLYVKAKEILKCELEEQILEDGAHFELSPMYHQIMLFRILDCVNLVKHNYWKEHELLERLQSKAEIMLGWLKNISYENGDIPLFNDSTNHIAPTSQVLFDYSRSLKLKTRNSKLKESGYRKIVNVNYECIVDIGDIGASYIPGHAHADTFNFELRIDGKPFIVDTGISTYATNDTRLYERSTTAHNTVQVLETDSSEVWNGFKVADRAEIINSKEEENYIEATHDGYKKYGVLHTRSWKFEDRKIIVEDILNKELNAVSQIHFHPDVSDEMIQKHIQCKTDVPLPEQVVEVKPKTYNYAEGFNTLIHAKYIELKFTKSCRIEIII